MSRQSTRFLWLLATALTVGFVLAWSGFTTAGDEKTVTLTVKDKNKEVSLSKGDKLMVKLPYTAGTGYTWVVAKKDDKVLKQNGEPKIERPKKGIVGARTSMTFSFEAVGEGTANYELQYKRPFEKDKKPAQIYKFAVKVK